MTGFSSKRAMAAGRHFDATEYWNRVHYSPLQDLVIETGTVYGIKYHTVIPVGGNWREMEQWAHQTYGEVGSIWELDAEIPKPGARWYMNNSRFWFRDERDLTMFILRWR